MGQASSIERSVGGSSAKVPPPAIIRKQITPQLKIVTLARAGIEELFITATPRNGGDSRRLIAEARRAARETGAAIVAEDVFGVPAATASDDGVRPDWPTTWLDADRAASPALAGVQVHAVKGVALDRIEQDGRIVGSIFDDGLARHCRLGDLRPADRSATPEHQARATFELAERALRSAGMEFTDVVRTWFYLDRILDWYGPFNRVRDGFFRERRVFDGLVPVSTGIGGANAARAALVANVYAVQPRAGRITIASVPSPLQRPALDYGSSFSRAVELALPDHRRLLISGTASIDADGRTIHTGDPARQTDQTMNIVAAILESRGMGWSEVTRAVVYLKAGQSAQLFADWCAAHGQEQIPAVTTVNDICREELLFEIELDAVQGDSRRSILDAHK